MNFDSIPDNVVSFEPPVQRSSQNEGGKDMVGSLPSDEERYVLPFNSWLSTERVEPQGRQSQSPVILDLESEERLKQPFSLTPSHGLHSKAVDINGDYFSADTLSVESFGESHNWPEHRNFKAGEGDFGLDQLLLSQKRQFTDVETLSDPFDPFPRKKRQRVPRPVTPKHSWNAQPLPQISELVDSPIFSMTFPHLIVDSRQKSASHSMDVLATADHDRIAPEIQDLDCDDLRRRLTELLEHQYSQKKLLTRMEVSRCSFLRFMNMRGPQAGLGHVVWTAARKVLSSKEGPKSCEESAPKVLVENLREVSSSSIVVPDPQTELRDAAAELSLYCSSLKESSAEPKMNVLPPWSTLRKGHSALNRRPLSVFDDCDTVRAKAKKLMKQWGLTLQAFCELTRIELGEGLNFLNTFGKHEGAASPAYSQWYFFIEIMRVKMKERKTKLRMRIEREYPNGFAHTSCAHVFQK